jgi:hypothetical protein
MYNYNLLVLFCHYKIDMYADIMKSKLTLILVIILAALISFRATSIDEDILKAKISTPTILITEGLIVLALIAIAGIFVPDIRRKIKSDFENISLRNVLQLSLYAALGLGLTLITNEALVHHGTNEVKMYELIVGILVTGAIYFMASGNRIMYNKVFYFLMIAVFAILFALD